MKLWLDYLRFHERTTSADTAIRRQVYTIHEKDAPPRVNHQVYAREIT